MPLSEVEVGGPVKASTQNGLIKNANGSPGRAVFTANGTWSVPAGVYRFKVTMCGGGGSGGNPYFAFGIDGQDSYNGGDGGDAPLCSKIFGGIEAGTTYTITIGAGAAAGSGAAGGTSTFGALLQSTGGGKGVNATELYYLPKQAKGTSGTHNGDLRHGNELFLKAQEDPYGSGGICSATAALQAGTNGICVIEW